MTEPATDEWAAMPLMLRVEEAAAVLRISRSKAYELTTLYTASAGINGLPVIRIGDLLRVPRFALQELVMTGQIVQLIQQRKSDSAASMNAPLTSSRKRSTSDRTQLSLLTSD